MITYATILERLSAGEPFAFARYGDGELLCMNGTKGSNADKHKFFGTLSRRLQMTVAVPKAKIDYALQNLARRDKRVKKALLRHTKVKVWHNADVLHRRSWHHGIEDFIELLHTKDVVLVGPEYLEPHDFPMIIVPRKDCWLQHEKTLAAIREAHRPGRVFLLACGMSAAVVIYDLVDECEGATFIDVGSALEPYIGMMIRAYHRFVLRRLRRQGKLPPSHTYDEEEYRAVLRRHWQQRKVSS